MSDSLKDTERSQAFEALLGKAARLSEGDRVIAGCALWRQGGQRMPDDLDISLKAGAGGLAETLDALMKAFPGYRWELKAKGNGAYGWSGSAGPEAPCIDASVDEVWSYDEPPVIDASGARLATLSEIAALKLWLVAKRDEAKDIEDLNTIEALGGDGPRAAAIALAITGTEEAQWIAACCDTRGLEAWSQWMRETLQ